MSSTEDLMEQEGFQRESNLTQNFKFNKTGGTENKGGIAGKQSPEEGPKNREKKYFTKFKGSRAK